MTNLEVGQRADASSGDHQVAALIDGREVARITGLSTVTVEHGRIGRGVLRDLPWIRVGSRAARYRLCDVLAWIEARVVNAPEGR